MNQYDNIEFVSFDRERKLVLNSHFLSQISIENSFTI